MLNSVERSFSMAQALLTRVAVAMISPAELPTLKVPVSPSSGQNTPGHFRPLEDQSVDTGIDDIPAPHPNAYRRATRARVSVSTGIDNVPDPSNTSTPNTPKRQLQMLLHDLYAGKINTDLVLQFLTKHPSLSDTRQFRLAAVKFPALNQCKNGYSNRMRGRVPGRDDYPNDGFDDPSWENFDPYDMEATNYEFDPDDFCEPFPPELTEADFPTTRERRFDRIHVQSPPPSHVISLVPAIDYPIFEPIRSKRTPFDDEGMHNGIPPKSGGQARPLRELRRQREQEKWAGPVDL